MKLMIGFAVTSMMLVISLGMPWTIFRGKAAAEPPRAERADKKKDAKKDAAAKTDKPKFTISKAATYVTGPLDKDGYIDYAAALNKRLSQGVTPANNANVLLWQALGPQPEGKKMPGEFFELMGMKPPPERGDYF